MNPLLAIPVILAGGKDADGDDKPEKVVIGRISPGEISHYYPGYDFGAIVVMKSGSSFLTTWSAEDLDHARVVYYDFVKRNPTNRMNVQMIPKDKPKSDA